METSIEYRFLWLHLLPSFTNEVSWDLNVADDYAIVNIESTWEEEHMVGYRGSFNYEEKNLLLQERRRERQETGTSV